jgi:hypothetical protein
MYYRRPNRSVGQKLREAGEPRRTLSNAMEALGEHQNCGALLHRHLLEL